MSVNSGYFEDKRKGIITNYGSVFPNLFYIATQILKIKKYSNEVFRLESFTRCLICVNFLKYRFSSLFAVDTFLKYWTANYEFSNKKTNVRLKLKN